MHGPSITPSWLSIFLAILANADELPAPWDLQALHAPYRPITRRCYPKSWHFGANAQTTTSASSSLGQLPQPQAQT